MIEQIATKVRDGGRVNAAEALALYREAPTHLLGSLADGIRARKHPDRHVTYIIDRNVNYTNICVARCNFCAFYRPVGSGDGYVLGFEEIFRKIDETIAVGSIEYLQSSDYRFVPGVGIGSRGPIASVALYTRVPVDEIRSIALDTSSRTSVSLIRVLCHHRFQIAPAFVPHGPDLAAMTRSHDAGLLIGDPAFDVDHVSLGLTKIDLGEEWTAMTGLPFIYATWTGRPGAITDAEVTALQDAQAEGVASRLAIAEEYGRGDAARTARAAVYLRDNVKYGLGADEAAGLQMFLDYAADLGLAPRRRKLEFF